MKRPTMFLVMALRAGRRITLAALCALVTPTPLFAQADQPTVLTCANGNGGQANLTLNSARTMVTMQLISPDYPPPPPFSGSVTSVTDQQIAMTFPGAFDPNFPDAAKWVLNRYSLQLTQVSHQQMIYTCQQQHRQL